jgi:hypothetical protein
LRSLSWQRRLSERRNGYARITSSASSSQIPRTAGVMVLPKNWTGE